MKTVALQMPKTAPRARLIRICVNHTLPGREFLHLAHLDTTPVEHCIHHIISIFTCPNTVRSIPSHDATWGAVGVMRSMLLAVCEMVRAWLVGVRAQMRRSRPARRQGVGVVGWVVGADIGADLDLFGRWTGQSAAGYGVLGCAGSGICSPGRR
jgi:hypothetical protein